MLVLGIESSCDETAASVVRDGAVLSDVVASQVEQHRPYGGVVPEIAGRNHVAAVLPTVRTALADAGCSVADLDGVAATLGPGLAGSLVVGLQAAKTIAAVRGIPFVGVNHLRGHLLAPRIGDAGAPVPFPYVALLASGGHTALYIVRSPEDITCLGQTRDDAAGEAFDKVAKVMGLGYPGGPIIDALAGTSGEEVAFPQALRSRHSYEFSFSGVKTAVAQYVASRQPLTNRDRAAVARGFQRAVVETLVRKTVRAARQHQIAAVAVVGGVAANDGLRTAMEAACAEADLRLFLPPKSRCTDNGAMIAYAGWLSLAAGERTPLDAAPRADWPV